MPAVAPQLQQQQHQQQPSGGLAEQRRWKLLVRSKQSTVYLDMSCMEVIKVVKKGKNERALANAERERAVLRRLAHPYVVQLRGSAQTPAAVHLRLEYAPGGDLFEVLRDLGSLPERCMRLYAAELASALSYLHQQGLAHRDVKPENILIDAQGHVKLCDFGLCSARRGISGGSGAVDGLRGLRTLCGTPPYTAPEVYAASAYGGGGYGMAVDWWSLGVVLYESLTGALPWNAAADPHYRPEQPDEPAAAALLPPPPPPPLSVPPYVSRHAADLIGALLEPLPALRLGAWASREVTAHEFFAGIEWQALSKRRVASPFNPLLARSAAAAAAAAAGTQSSSGAAFSSSGAFDTSSHSNSANNLHSGSTASSSSSSSSNFSSGNIPNDYGSSGGGGSGSGGARRAQGVTAKALHALSAAGSSSSGSSAGGSSSSSAGGAGKGFGSGDAPCSGDPNGGGGGASGGIDGYARSSSDCVIEGARDCGSALRAASGSSGSGIELDRRPCVSWDLSLAPAH